MEGPEGSSGKAYSAFISYSSADRAFAERLQRRIEAYRFPAHIVRATGRRRLKPVFRDRTEMAASADLNRAIRDALDESDCMIVICSPAAVQSRWVGYEIGYFRQSGGDRRILAALAGGDEKTSFPRELLAGGEDAWPLAADFRPEGDGERQALLKLIAAMAGLRLDGLIRRDTQRRVRRIQYGAAALVAAAGATAGVAVVTLQARATAAEERARSAQAAQFQLGYVRKKLEVAGRLDLLDAVDKGVEQYFNGRTIASMTPEERLQRATLLHKQGDSSFARGHFLAARKKYTQGYALTASVLRQRPNDLKVLYAQAQSDLVIGKIAWQMRDLQTASRAFHSYANRAAQLLGSGLIIGARR